MSGQWPPEWGDSDTGLPDQWTDPGGGQPDEWSVDDAALDPEASEVTLFLASVLPSPKRSYFAADGHVTPGWAGYLRASAATGVPSSRSHRPYRICQCAEACRAHSPSSRVLPAPPSPSTATR